MKIENEVYVVKYQKTGKHTYDIAGIFSTRSKAFKYVSDDVLTLGVSNLQIRTVSADDDIEGVFDHFQVIDRFAEKVEYTYWTQRTVLNPTDH